MRGALDERITAVLTIEGSLDGSCVVRVRPTDVRISPGFVRGSLLLSVWREHGSGVRMSLRNPVTGAVAHLQSGESIIGFVREFGIEVEP